MNQSDTEVQRMNDIEPSAWSDARRIESWAGEIRVNMIRLAAIVIFYARHLVELYVSPHDSPVRGVYHARVTVIVLAWAMAAVGLHVVLARRRLPAALQVGAVLLDLLMTTLVCCVAGGPRTALIVLYFAVLASAPLRLSLRVVYAATTGAVVGYLFVVGYYAWHVIGIDRYYATAELRIPRGEQAIVVLALLVTGLFAGQTVRQARRLIGSGGPKGGDPAHAPNVNGRHKSSKSLNERAASSPYPVSNATPRRSAPGLKRNSGHSPTIASWGRAAISASVM